MSLQWRDQLSVGNDLIDSDHKYLIEIINRAEASLKAKNRRELAEALDSLDQYYRVHFAPAIGWLQSPQDSTLQWQWIEWRGDINRCCAILPQCR